jgi:hypothetical protein
MNKRLLSFAIPFLGVSLLAQWTPLTTGTLSNRSMCRQNGDLYLVSYPNGVLKSESGTGPFTAVNTGLPMSGTNWFVQSIGEDGAYLYAGTESGIYRSASGADSWSNINGTLTASSTVYANKFYSIGGSIMAVFAGSISQGGGIYRSSNFGNTWLIGHSGMGSNVQVYTLTQVGPTLFASTSTGLWTSTDNAQSWTAHPVVNYTTYSLVSINNTLVIVSSFGIRYSTNSGSSWLEASGDPASPAKGELVAFDGKLYALVGTSTGCLRSTDNGASWNAFITGFSPVDAQSQEEFHATSQMLYCTALFDVYSLPSTGTAVDETAASAAPRIFPTVCSNGFTLSSPSAAGHLLLFDGLGRQVLNETLTGPGDLFVPRGSLASGLYQAFFQRTGSRASIRLGAVMFE